MLLMLLRHRTWSYVKGEFTTEERDRRLSWATNPKKLLAIPEIHPGHDIVMMSECIHEPTRSVGSQAPFRLSVFELKPGTPMEVGFRYDASIIGYPTRNSFVLGPLEAGRPLELRINGKRDFNLSSRRERTYTEQRFRLELHDDWKPGDTIPYSESGDILLIDLRKPMW
jgi:hypothetical protein